MKPSHQRALKLAVLAIGFSLAIGLILKGLDESVMYFYSPSQITQDQVESEKRIRLGGMVMEGSLTKLNAKSSFNVTDYEREISVSYEGILPDLFREGQGVVMEGKLVNAESFIADTVLAKHDESYMPPEVAKNLKKPQYGDNIQRVGQ